MTCLTFDRLRMLWLCLYLMFEKQMCAVPLSVEVAEEKWKNVPRTIHKKEACQTCHAKTSLHLKKRSLNSNRIQIFEGVNFLLRAVQIFMHHRYMLFTLASSTQREGTTLGFIFSALCSVKYNKPWSLHLQMSFYRSSADLEIFCVVPTLNLYKA